MIIMAGSRQAWCWNSSFELYTLIHRQPGVGGWGGERETERQRMRDGVGGERERETDWGLV